jgi:osmoprotectant transport system permease protein
VAGLAVNDTQRMLAGAIPAALLALAVQGALAGVQRWLVAAPLRGVAQRPGTT